MRDHDTLLGVQRSFLAALREPIYGDSRARSDLAPREGHSSRAFVDTADSLLTPSANMSPAERLELYHRQYWYRLLDSIAEDFPALRRLIGEEDFWRLIEAYLEATPPTSFTLRHLGARLADFIHRHPESTACPVHAEDLARLEYALVVAFEAEHVTPVAPGELAGVRVALQPHVQLLALRTRADASWWRSTVASNERPSDTPNRFVVVFRADGRSEVERLPELAFAMLWEIDRTHSLDAAMDRVASRKNLVRSGDLERVKRWFARWTTRGWLRLATD